MRVSQLEYIDFYSMPEWVDVCEFKNGRLTGIDPGLRRAFLENTVKTRVESHLFANKANIINSPPDWNRVGNIGFSWLEEGSLDEIPKSVHVLERFRVPRNNGQLWREAKENPDLIVVSDYDIGKVEITAQPEFQQSSTGSSYRNADFRLIDVWPDQSQPFPGYFYISPYYVTCKASIFIDYRRRYTRTYSLPEVPISAQEIFSRCQFRLNEKLITRTLASADKACIDVLTAVAEMPELLRSIIAGIRLIVKMVADFKQRKITLTQAFDKRRARIDRAFEFESQRIMELHKRARTKAQKRNHERKLKRLQETYSRAVNDSAKEFVDAVASIWMNFRYNIMPTVYTIQDAEKLFESYSADFITTRDKDAHVFQIEPFGWGPLDIVMRESCVIKRGINPNIRFTALTHANFITTLWELVPLSFVIDWFVNVGDVLTSAFSPNLAPSSGSTAGIKFACEETIVSEITGQTCHYRINIYRRRVISPESVSSLVLQPEINLFRVLDSLALLWSPIRDSLLSSKRK